MKLTAASTAKLNTWKVKGKTITIILGAVPYVGIIKDFDTEWLILDRGNNTTIYVNIVSIDAISIIKEE